MDTMNTSELFTIISTVLIAYAAVFVLFGALLGFKRGAAKSGLRLLTVAVAAVLSFFVARYVGDYVLGALDGNSLDSVLSSFNIDISSMSDEAQEIITSLDPSVVSHIVAIPLFLLIVPVIFVVLFFVAKLVLWIVFAILAAILGMSKKHKGFGSRLVGTLLGAVQGAAIVVITLLPLAGIISLAGEVKAPLTVDNVDEASKDGINEFYDNLFIDELSEHPVFKAVSTCCGDIVYRSLSKVELDNTDYYMKDLAIKAAQISADIMSLSDMDAAHPEYKRDDISALIDHATKVDSSNQDAKYTAVLLSSAISSFAKVAEDNIDEMMPMEEPYRTFVVDTLRIFETSNQDNINADLKTIADVYFMLGEYNVLYELQNGTSESLLDALIAPVGDTIVINKCIDLLNTYPRTQPIVNSLASISIAIMCQQMDMDEDVQVIYENVKDGVNDILKLDKNDFETTEEYKAAVKTDLNATLIENGIELDDDVLDGMTDYIAENFDDVEEITDADVSQAILSYYDAYAKAMEDGKLDKDELPDDFPDIPDGVLDDLPSNLPDGIEDLLP